MYRSDIKIYTPENANTNTPEPSLLYTAKTEA